MNRAIATQVLPDRPKYLRPASGVFAVVHAPQGGSEIHERECPSLTPERCETTRSAVRDKRQRQIKALARNAMKTDGLTYEDVGAACHRRWQHVQDMLAPDGRNMSADDIVGLALVSESFKEGMIEMMRCRRSAK